MSHDVPRSQSRLQDRLCRVCSKIDFHKYRYASMNELTLGRWRDLVASQPCPFCRTLVRALSSSYSSGSRSLDDIVMLKNGLSWELGIEISPYNQFQSAGHSNLFDLRSVSKRCQRLPYRFIAFVKHHPREPFYLQYIADPIQDRKENKFLGRSVDRATVDTKLLRSWIGRCENFHMDICEEDGVAGRWLPRNLRLIDVVNRNLVRAPTSEIPQYFTLSYVWGVDLMKQKHDLEPVITMRADLKHDENGKECTPLTENLPKTIADAMWLTQQLGCRYLWVDALCIVQDDPIEEKRTHLEKMDAVYNCSKLTIVAASGLHANAGLPGVSMPRRYSQVREEVDSFEIAAMAPSFSQLENSRTLIWNTRGWTFQEKMLAKRILLFTDYQVYFRCSESIWTEEVFMETQDPSKSIEARAAKYRWVADRQPHIPSTKLMIVKMLIPQLNISDEWNYLGKFPDYAAAIREYSQRQLSNQKDVLIAVDGLLRTLRMDTGRFVCGLPEAHLLQSLLWHVEPGCTQTRVDHSLPTWTWASWAHEKGVAFDVLDIRLLRVVVLIIRNVMNGIGKRLKKLGKSSGSSSPSSGDASSGTSDSSYTSSSSTSSSSSSDSSSGVPLVPPPPMPMGGRDWTTVNAMGKASANLALCFSLPLMFQHHTVKHVFLYEDYVAKELESEEPLSYKTFAQGQKRSDSDDSDDSRETNRTGQKRLASRKVLQRHSRQAGTIRGPVLAFKTMIVRLRTGKCLSKPPPREDNECGVFELLDSDDSCVGEVWTTLEHGNRGRTQALEFLTISWGLSLQYARVAERWIPRWANDAKILSKSRMNILFKACSVVEEVMSWNAGKHLAGNYGTRNPKSATESQPSLMSFCDALLTAKKGEALPKFLWSTVNLLQVERNSSSRCYKRMGTGRMIFEAWLCKWSLSEDVILA